MPLANGSDHIIQLPTTSSVEPDKVDASKIAREWLLALESYLSKTRPVLLDELFHDDSWWRDMLVLEWDFHTVNSIYRIEGFIGKNQPRVHLGNFCLRNGNGKCKPKMENPVPGLHWLSAMFSFECTSGRGSGVFYLTKEREGAKWKAYSVYVALQELHHCKERLGSRRPEGTVDFMDGIHSRPTWTEQRKIEAEFQGNCQPAVLIIGAGNIQIPSSTRYPSFRQW